MGGRLHARVHARSVLPVFRRKSRIAKCNPGVISRRGGITMREIVNGFISSGPKRRKPRITLRDVL